MPVPTRRRCASHSSLARHGGVHGPAVARRPRRPASPVRDARRAAAAQVLERRTDCACDHGDLDAFLGTVDPSDAATWSTSSGRGSGGCGQLPEHTVEAVAERQPDAPPPTSSLTTYVNQEVQLAGIDQKPVGVGHLATFGLQRRLLAGGSRTSRITCRWSWHRGTSPGSVVVHRGGVVLVTDETSTTPSATGSSTRPCRRGGSSAGSSATDEPTARMTAESWCSPSPRPEAMKANGFYHQSLDLTGGVELPVKAGPDEVDFRVLVAPSELERRRRVVPAPCWCGTSSCTCCWPGIRSAPTWATEGAAEFYASGRAGGPVTPIAEMVPPGSRHRRGRPADRGRSYAGDWAARAGNYAVSWAAMAYLGPGATGPTSRLRLVRATAPGEGRLLPEAGRAGPRASRRAVVGRARHARPGAHRRPALIRRNRVDTAGSRRRPQSYDETSADKFAPEVLGPDGRLPGRPGRVGRGAGVRDRHRTRRHPAGRARRPGDRHRAVGADGRAAAAQGRRGGAAGGGRRHGRRRRSPASSRWSTWCGTASPTSARRRAGRLLPQRRPAPEPRRAVRHRALGAAACAGCRPASSRRPIERQRGTPRSSTPTTSLPNACTSHHYWPRRRRDGALRLRRLPLHLAGRVRPDGPAGRDGARGSGSATGTGSVFDSDSESHVSVWRKP